MQVPFAPRLQDDKSGLFFSGVVCVQPALQKTKPSESHMVVENHLSIGQNKELKTISMVYVSAMCQHHIYAVVEFLTRRHVSGRSEMRPPKSGKDLINSEAKVQIRRARPQSKAGNGLLLIMKFLLGFCFLKQLADCKMNFPMEINEVV